VPSYRPTYTPPVIFGSQALDYGPALAREMPDAGVLRLKDARVFTPQGWVVGEDDHYLPDNSWFGWETRPFDLSIYARTRLGPLTHVRGTSLNLTSEFATGNYAHLVLDGLSRPHLFLATGMDVASLDHVLVPTRTYPILGRFLSRFGIPKAKVIAANEAAHVRCDKLWAPSFPGRRRNTPYWVVDFWRDGFRSETERPPLRRLYISRRGRILNEADIKPILDRRGFEEIRGDVDPSVFAEAAVVVWRRLGGYHLLPPGNKGPGIDASPAHPAVFLCAGNGRRVAVSLPQGFVPRRLPLAGQHPAAGLQHRSHAARPRARSHARLIASAPGGGADAAKARKIWVDPPRALT
jgi:hypothetical protein